MGSRWSVGEVTAVMISVLGVVSVAATQSGTDFSTHPSLHLSFYP